MAKKNKLKIIPLGGLDEIGKNMTVIEYGNEMIMVDCGMSFPDDDMNGVGFVISKEEDLTLGPGTRLDHSRAFI